MPHRSDRLSSDHEHARQFTAVAWALTALAALAFALLVHNDMLALPLDEEARRVIAWSFVGLAALDAALLLVWRRLVTWIAGMD